MTLCQDKDFIEKYKKTLSGQSSSLSPPRRFEERPFTKCRHSPWYQLHFLIHSASAVIGVEATPLTTAGFPTSNLLSTPSIQDSGQESAFHTLQTSIPQMEVGLEIPGEQGVSLSMLMDPDPPDLAPPGPYFQELDYPQFMSIGEPAPPLFLDQSVAYPPSPLPPVGMDAPAEIFLTHQYLRSFLPGSEPTDRQVEFLVHQARAATRNQF